MMKNAKSLVRIAAIAAAVAVALPGCAIWRRDRCYLAETRYLTMRALFEQTGSYQRVAQAMDDEQWAGCEVNTFRYRLRKDLGLEGDEFNQLVLEIEPYHQTLPYNPGIVRKTVEDESTTGR